uniref:ATP synthase subunit a n=1 Tax=Ceratobaeus sp. MM-2013 TaxID=1429432 RepID=A0A067YFN0_9HYME|nr:ATP synthase F0 subunit 6 [Ceratobaeus sp. MM-2013]
MMSIFNIFDPMTSNMLALNWLMMSIPMFFMMNNYWLIFPRWNHLWMKIFIFINNEMKIILKKKIFNLNFVSIFVMIMMINFMGLFSFVFTSSSHMIMNLSLALPFWISFMLMGWIFNCNHMLVHQVPMGTPNLLMPFMVVIEMISNLIRPGTLSIRLTANMIAGHLLLTLISNNGNKLMILLSILLILTQTMLMMLEMSVAFIQAYVFTILLSLYSQEI